MRIGFDGRYAEGDLVGVGKYIKSLVSGLSSSGVECFVFYSKKPKYKISGRNITSITFPKSNRLTFEQILLPIALRKYKIDLYHAPGNLGVPLLTNIKIVLTIHDLIPLQVINYFSYSKLPQISKYLYLSRLNSSISKSDKIINDSEYTKNLLIKKGVSKNKISVIYPGLEKLPEPFSKNIYGDYILNNGGLDIRKNTDGLIKSFAAVHKDFPGLKLIITGNNPKYIEELLGLIKSLGLQKSVVFVGYVDDKELATLIKNAKCVCYPSLIEGFGFPVVEAFSLGVPVVSSNTSSIPEIAGKAAVLVNPKNTREISNAIISVLKGNKLRQVLIKAGYEQVKKFSWKISINKYLDLYKSMLK
jgi:glycosyltransferase involved in cell wall biosynthesis